MAMTETTFSHDWRVERALPIANGRVAMWLFLSTEVMLFAALLSSYAIFRMSVADWPTAAEMRVQWWIGLINTCVLLASSWTLHRTVGYCLRGGLGAARIWLIATLLLVALFLSFKSWEFFDKWRHGIFNWGGPTLIHDRADLHYLSHLRRTFREQHAIRADSGAGESPLGINDTSDWLPLAHGGLVDWTGQFIGQEADSDAAHQSLTNTAALIYPSHGLPIEGLATELAALRILLAERLEHYAAHQQEWEIIQTELGTLRAAEETSPLAVEDRQRMNVLAGRATNLGQNMAQAKARLDPLRDRVALLERTEPNWYEGLNHRLGWRLPMVIPNGQTWASLYLLLAGCHAVHVIGGGLAMLVCWPRRTGSGSAAALGNIRLYWYFVDVVWIGLWVLFYF